MCRPAWCLLLRERSARGPVRLILFPPPALSLGRLRRAGAGQLASTERPWTIPKAMRQEVRAGGLSPDGPGAILSNARRSLITFFMRPVPPVGAGGSLMCTLSSNEVSTLAIVLFLSVFFDTACVGHSSCPSLSPFAASPDPPILCAYPHADDW